MKTSTKLIVGGVAGAALLAMLMGKKGYKKKDTKVLNFSGTSQEDALAQLSSRTKELLGAVDILMTDVSRRMATRPENSFVPALVCEDIAESIGKFNQENSQNFDEIIALLKHLRGQGVNLSGEVAQGAGLNAAAIGTKYMTILAWVQDVTQKCQNVEALSGPMADFSARLQELAQVV